MPEELGSKSSRESGMGLKKTVLVCCLILLFGAGLVTFIFLTEPTGVRTGATRETAMLVETVAVERGTFRPTIVVMGTVVPSQDIILRPRVSGKVVELSREFTPGGFVEEGETLLRIDYSDYKNALQERQSDLRQALADLDIEKGRRNVALKDYQLLGEALPKENEALVLREPQLNIARARVEAARAAVDQAMLQLQRTDVKAPFDAHVLSRSVNVGSQVSVGDALGRLVGLDTYWVEMTVPLSKLRRLSFPDSFGAKGSEVLIRNRSAWAEGEYRTGRIYKLVGALEDGTRMARVLVSVKDPLAREPNAKGSPAMIIGSFVEARIQAREIADVIRVKRDYVRKDDTFWVMKDGRLDIRDVVIAFRDAEYAYISEGLSEGDRVVTTNLATVAEGAKLREEASGAEPGTVPVAGERKQEEGQSSEGAY